MRGRWAFALLLALLGASGCRFGYELLGAEEGLEDGGQDAGLVDLGSGRDGEIVVTAGQTLRINEYSQVVTPAAAGAMTITVAQGQLFAAGDLVLIWRGADAGTFPSGEQAALDMRGVDTLHAELHVLSAVGVDDGVLELTAPLDRAAAALVSQVVRVPQLASLTVEAEGSVVGQPWNGATGGIVALVVAGPVVLDGAIDARAIGLRGAIADPQGEQQASQCEALEQSAPLGEQKGESLAIAAYGTATGRGNLGNGGGGGVCHNGSGGGGGNAGAGGDGGNDFDDHPNPGLGGAPLVLEVGPQLSMGGGGGAGESHHDDGSAAGSGGGVIYLAAGSLSGAGLLVASGGDAQPAGHDGSGGGGAGGTIYVRTTGALACGGAEARGGAGGDADDRMGIGGGGGGGFIRLVGASVACPQSVEGGAPGQNSAGSNPRPGSAGAPGLTLL